MIMEYAAVIIPTLNRKTHLQRCVESLKRGRYAEKTDLYISVDYPPSKKYEEGYQEVVEYVKSISGFGTVNIYFQEKNLGPGLNRRFLEGKIADTHDKYVFTDDDNEFSKNFLEYINWGLEKYKDDESIYAIGSCVDFDYRGGNSSEEYFLTTSYNPYGTGHWLHKNKKCEEYLVQKSLNQIYKSKELQNLLYKYSPMVYMWVAQDSLRRVSPMRGKHDNLTYIDIWENVYIIVNGLKCVKPLKPKSRNWGLDGSGIHSNQNDIIGYVPNQSLDIEDTWCRLPKRLNFEYEAINEVLHKEKFSITEAEKNFCSRIYSLNAIFGNNCVYGVFKILKKIKNVFLRKKNSEEIMYG